MTDPNTLTYADGMGDRLSKLLELRALEEARPPREARRRRAYTKEEETPWQREQSRATTGPAGPLTYRDMPTPERHSRIRELIAQGLGDGSIAVRMNREGVSCNRAEVYTVRTGRVAPDGQGGFEEMSISSVK